MIHYNETVFKDMHDYVEKFLNEEGGLTIERCQQEGLKEYDPDQYIELETLGKGACGIVKKGKFIPQHELHAVKTVRMRGISGEIIKEKLVCFLVEAKICIVKKRSNNILYVNILEF